MSSLLDVNSAIRLLLCGLDPPKMSSVLDQYHLMIFFFLGLDPSEMSTLLDSVLDLVYQIIKELRRQKQCKVI